MVLEQIGHPSNLRIFPDFSVTAPYVRTLRRSFQITQILHHMRVRQEAVSERSSYCTICVCYGTERVLHHTDTALMRVPDGCTRKFQLAPRHCTYNVSRCVRSRCQHRSLRPSSLTSARMQQRPSLTFPHKLKI